VVERAFAFGARSERDRRESGGGVVAIRADRYTEGPIIRLSPGELSPRVVVVEGEGGKAVGSDSDGWPARTP